MTRRGFLGAMATGMVAGATGAAYSQRCAYDLRLESHELKVKGWQADGLRVAVLADLHMNSAAEMKRASQAVGMAIRQKPDLIVIVGDFIDASGPRVLPNLRKALNQLGDAGCPTVAVMGNHDYWTQRPHLVIEELRRCNLTLLRNEIKEFHGVSIVGIDDSIASLAKYDFFPAGSVSKSTLVLLHEPDSVEHVPDHASLQISGHSHGGQICLPFGIPVHTPYGAKKYKAGFYGDLKVPTYVTRGVGTTGPNYRLFCPPEVSLLTLRQA